MHVEATLADDYRFVAFVFPTSVFEGAANGLIFFINVFDDYLIMHCSIYSDKTTATFTVIVSKFNFVI